MHEPAQEPAQPSAASSHPDHLDLHLPSTLESVSAIEAAAEALALRMGFDEDSASSLAMVTREAAINACKHGNHFAPDKQLHATLTRTLTHTVDTLTITIADQGPGLDPDTLPDPCDPANLLRSSGRGVFLMRALVDEVHFRQLQPGTEVTLIKHKLLEATS